MEKDKLGPLSSFMGTISFMGFGILGYINLRTPWNMTNIVFGIIVGLFFGFISKFIFSRLLSILNKDLRNIQGKGTIKRLVKRCTIFMFPYAVLTFLAEYYLGWAAAAVFFSAGIMNTGVTISLEVGKLKGKTAIKNTIVTSLSAAAVSYFWVFSAGYLKNVPGMVESLLALGLSLLGVKK